MLDYSIDFTNGAKVTIKKGDLKDYRIIFTDNDTKEKVYISNISPGSWSKTNEIYYKNWNIKIIGNDETLVNYDINLKKKKVLIRFQSKSLGDSIAWVPYVDKFRKLHGCNIYCSTFLNDLYKNEYPDVKFIQPGQTPDNTFAIYDIGWFNPREFMNPQDYKIIPLQQTITDILGMKYKEIIPSITKSKMDKPVEYKYVCIAEFSTANAKHWHYPSIDKNEGWQTLVDWLNDQGYKVMVISKQQTHLKNIIDRTGNFPLNYRIHELIYSEFFIGVGSGLSWLAWALGKKVVMISGFSDPICEFKENNIRIINTDVCNGCFNKYKFDRGDWNWCPVHKDTIRQFECTKNITPEMVINEIKNNKLVDKLVDTILEQDIEINNEKNKLYIHYKNDIPINNIDINITDGHGNMISANNLNLLPNQKIRVNPINIENDIIIINFLRNKKTLLKLNYML